jgi:hypothetical protein
VRDALDQWARPAPRFLLLAGDASYDPRGYLDGQEIDLVPTRLVPTAFSGWTASDVWLALPDDSPQARPALAAGRFPAQTAEQIEAMVAKTLEAERAGRQSDWAGAALIAADNDEPGFEAGATAFAGDLAGYQATVLTIAGDGAEVREALRSRWNAGLGLVGYFGHGSVELWAKEKIFAVDEVPALANRGRYPLMFTLTCLSGLFQHPTTPSLAEAVLRADGKGAVAAFVPSSAARLEDQHELAAQLARALSGKTEEGLRLGDLIREAQLAMPSEQPAEREILLTFNLLGDPSMRWDGR